jgi:hypothetical protein
MEISAYNDILFEKLDLSHGKNYSVEGNANGNIGLPLPVSMIHGSLVFEIERLADGKVVVFLPGSPDPWSGSVSMVTHDRVTLLDMTVKSATGLRKCLGRGTTRASHDVDARDQPSE